jgi:hypothetical protein
MTSIAVSLNTTLEDIHHVLERHCLLPSVPSHHRPYSFWTFGSRGRSIAWDETIGSIGLHTLSHIQLRVEFPGGAETIIIGKSYLSLLGF